MSQHSPKAKTFIIAEAGVNHNGELEIARSLIDAAADAGADAVKFQTFKAENLVTRKAPKAAYQQKATEASESHFDMLKGLELDFPSHRTLLHHCRGRGIRFLSAPFDLESIDLLDSLGLDFFKIPSGEITNLPYLRKIGRLGKSVIMSSGMSYLGEIEAALMTLVAAGLKRTNITVLHCNTEYPTPMEDVNLKAMQTIGRAFPGINVGYSDHTLGLEVPVAAVAMGASVIEKHFTLDRSMKGPDHRASLEPNEFKAMVAAIRNIETAMGSGVKVPSASELKNRLIARKSIVAARAILKGEVLNESNLAVKRAGGGIDPMRWDEVMGRRAGRDYQVDEPIDA
jgi:N,N'-diacetyllegionaminate synthase